MIIGVGNDIVEIERIEQAVQKNATFFKRIYTNREQQYYISQNKRVETLAGIFSAKEAVSKALGTGFRGFGPSEIEIIPNELGKPEVYLYGEARTLGDKLAISNVLVSISHCKTYATAFAVIEGAS